MADYDEAELDHLSTLDGEARESYRRYMHERDDPVISRLNRIDHNVRDIGRAVLIVGALVGIVLLLILRQ